MRIQRIFAALLVALTLAALGSIAPQPAAAATDNPVTMSFTATVVEVNDWAHAMGNVQVGDTITGTYTYNAAASDGNPSPDYGSYDHRTAPYGMRANIAGKVVETDPQNILFLVSLVNNVNGRDVYSVGSYYNRPFSGLYEIINFYLALYDPTQTALKNTNLTKTAPRLSDWQQSQTALQPWGFYVRGKDPNSDYEFYLRAFVTQVQKV